MKLKATLKFSHMNNGLEMEGEEVGALRNDLKLTGSVKVSELAGLFDSEDEHERVIGNLYNDAELASNAIKEIELSHEFDKVKVDLVGELDGEISFKDAKLNKIRITPKEGRTCEISCRLQVKATEKQFGILGHHMLGHNVTIKASGELVEVDEAQDDLPLNHDAPAEAEAAVH